MEEINKIKSGFDVINNTIDDYCDYYKNLNSIIMRILSLMNMVMKF